MKPRQFVGKLVFVTLIVITLSGCTVSPARLQSAVATASVARALTAEPATPQPPQQVLATATPASATKPVVVSEGSELTVEDVAVLNGYPPGCDPDALPYANDSCFALAPEGYALLLVTLRPLGDSVALRENLADVRKEIFVVSDDDTKHECELWGSTIAEDGEYDISVAFALPTPVPGVTLFWPNNPGIDLREMIDSKN